MFTRVYQTLRDTGTQPAVRIAGERVVNDGVDEEERIVHIVQNSPRASSQCSPTSVCRTLHAGEMYPYHLQRVQHLGPGDFAEKLEFCKWLNGSRELHRYSNSY